MASLFTNGKFTALGPTGVIPGARLYTYAATSLTPQATYTSQDGGSPNANPVVCNASGQASVWLGAATYRMVLKDASDVVVWEEDHIAAPGSFLQAGTGAVTRSVQDKLKEQVSVLDFGAVGDDVADDTAAIQAAITASPSVYFPKGTYKISAKLILRSDSELSGENSRNTYLQGAHSGTIFEFPYLSSDTRIEDLYFQGSGCTGIAVATTAGPFHDYLPRCHISHCQFSFDLAYGINADVINTHISDCTFGFTGPFGTNSGWVGTMVALNCAHSDTNYINLNSVNRCIFKVGTSTVAGIHLDAGTVFNFNHCDFEGGGKVLSATNVSGLSFVGCWFENSTTAAGVVDLSAAAFIGHCVFDRCQISATAEASPAFFKWASGWNTNAVTFRNCYIGLDTTTNLVLDVTTSTAGPIADNRFHFEGNFISGGISGTPLTASADFGGKNKAKAWAIINTASSGSIVSCSDPGATIARNGTGDCTLNFSFVLGTATTSICPVATGQDTFAAAFSTTDAHHIRVKAFDRSSPASGKDDIVQVIVMGQ
jgi:hypothetical protein